MSNAILSGDQILVTGITQAQAKDLGARWSGSRNAWSLPATRMNATVLIEAGLGLPNLRGAVEPPEEHFHLVASPDLYPYQRKAAAKLAVSSHGLLEVLSPGLGKTAVAITAADNAVTPKERIIVIAPAPLLRTWEREIARWSLIPGRVYIMQGKIDYEAAHNCRWIVTSWDKAAREFEQFGKGWPLVILDESVLTKSRQSKRFKAMKKIRAKVQRMWLLSGSPTTRHADDLWAQLHLLWPAAFPSYWRFAERYCYIEETPWAKVVTGTRPNRDAAEENSDLMYVVNQEDVLDLPEYLFETIDVELDGRQAREYVRMEKEFIAELGDGSEVIAANEVSRLQKLQQITSYWDGNSSKHDALIELLPSYEGPHLIWTHWREGAAALTTRIRDAGYQVAHVDGETPNGARDYLIEEFKKGTLQVLILSVGVGKFGHTLTGSKTVWYVDKTWNGDDYFQSLRRVRRIGLTHRPVVITLRAPGTVDELVEENLEGKMGGISRITRSRLAELLKGLGR